MTNDPLLGKQLANYRIDYLIGRGGMARVYYGWDLSLHRPVAIKVIDQQFRDNPNYTQRFIQEARSVATWRHENILQVYYAGSKDGLYYFAMEYIDGLDLGQLFSQYADSGELMPHEDVIRIGRAVASALDYAHHKQVVHRDIKPSNIMISRNNRTVLADFGLALDVAQGSMGETFGTPHYIAPEQAQKSSLAVPQSDIYSLGIIIYELLTGKVPFDDPSPTSVVLQHLTIEPPAPRALNPNLNEATEKVLLKVLHKEVEERYQTGKEFIDALADALAEGAPDVNDSWELPPPPSGVAPPPRRNLSQMSVSDRVSLHSHPWTKPKPAQITNHAQQDESIASAPPPSTLAPPPTQMDKGRSPMFWGIASLIGVVILVAIAFTAYWVGQSNTSEPTPIVAVVTATNSPVTTTTVLPTQTAIKAPATTTPTSQSTAVVLPPNTSTKMPATATATATIPPVTSTPSSTPTNTPIPSPTSTPTGQRLVFFYNDSSFYVWNPNRDRVRVTSLVFESLDNSGLWSGYSLAGNEWAQFFSFVEPNSCVSLEVFRESHLNPSQCFQFNSQLTPNPDDDRLFWVDRIDVVAFRVLWNGSEIGRCDTGLLRCEVYIP